ncbi:MAG: hypothetical protein EBU66_15640 [Bacteroidetes bacterium]|nr:hypothetical protein [Bacteroidota bacterium]
MLFRCASVVVPILTAALITLQPFLIIKVPFSLVNYGENIYKDRANIVKSSIHAEVNAMNKLPTLRRNKKPKKVDLLVIRTSRTEVLGNSKPCIHCILQLKEGLPLKGYILNTVYYSDTEGKIHKVKFSELIDDTDPHMSRFYKEKNMQIKNR